MVIHIINQAVNVTQSLCEYIVYANEHLLSASVKLAAVKDTLTCFRFNSSSLNKMAAILADDVFKWIFLNENDRNPIQISLKFVSRSTIDNKLALVQVMTWRWTSGKPLPEPNMTQFIDAYMQH